MDDNARIVERAEGKYHEMVMQAASPNAENTAALLIGWILGKDCSAVQCDIAKSRKWQNRLSTTES